MTLVKQLTRTDHQIQLDVIADVERDWRFKPAEIGVEVDAGVVTLTGTVSSYFKVGEAADIAARVPGVRDVANKLKVTIADPMFKDDTKIAQAVRNAMVWDSVVPEERIDSIVRDGVVTLKGTVDYWYQRRSAVDVVTRISGVVGVNDHIVIVPPARTDEQIFDHVRAALTRRLPLEEIDVTVDKGTVTLMGKVPSYHLRNKAEDVVWFATGVKAVNNKIAVS